MQSPQVDGSSELCPGPAATCPARGLQDGHTNHRVMHGLVRGWQTAMYVAWCSGPAQGCQRLRRRSKLGARLAHSGLTESMQAQTPDRRLLHGAWAAGSSSKGTIYFAGSPILSRSAHHKACRCNMSQGRAAHWYSSRAALVSSDAARPRFQPPSECCRVSTKETVSCLTAQTRPVCAAVSCTLRSPPDCCRASARMTMPSSPRDVSFKLSTCN